MTVLFIHLFFNAFDKEKEEIVAETNNETHSTDLKR